MRGWWKAIAVAWVVVALGAIAVVAVFATRRNDRSDECRFRLMRMWNALGAAETDRSSEWDRQPQGRAFWDRARDWPSARIPIDRRDLVCPVLGRTEPGAGLDRIDYRGPASSYRRLKFDDPIAADRPGNHPDRGNVLLKSGLIAEADDRLWRRAAETTGD